jgi:hypothetical protein
MFLVTSYLNAQEWTWMKGTNLVAQYGVYGTQGVSAAANNPGSRICGATWKDASGNLWLFGGGGYAATMVSVGGMSDLWKYNILTNQWTWINGPSAPDQNGIYGTQGVPAASNNPGGRQLTMSWTDNNGNFWLYGGYGAAISSGGHLSDLWKYDVSTNLWTWIQGSSSAGQTAVYGTLGVAAAANTPGGRHSAVTWTDNNGNLWMFGGSAYGNALNDLWMYNISTNQWTWMNGSNTTNQPGVYGTQGAAAAANTPGARIFGNTWTDNSNNLWLFGGSGLAGTGQGDLNDLWKYSISTNQWTWMKGSSTASAQAVYGTQGISAAGNTPGSRAYSASWRDASGNLWLFGGEGYVTTSIGLMNDLWKYNPTTNEWTWIKGSNSINSTAVYGTQGVQASANVPGGRRMSFWWLDNNNNLWMFGGYGYTASTSSYLNDLWRFVICTVLPPTPSNITSSFNQNICEGNTTTLSVSSSTYTTNWYASSSSTNAIGIGSSYTTPVLTAGSYSYYAAAVGCQPSASRAIIVVNVNPNPTLSVNNATICVGQTYVISPSGATSYTFSGGTATVSPVSTTAYTITGKGPTGCPATNTVICAITVNTLPQIIANSGSICAGSSFTITPSGASTYTYSGGSPIVNPAATTSYSVTGTSVNGCVSTTPGIVTVSVYPLPTLQINTSSPFICPYQSVTLTVGGAASYSWSGGPATASFVVNPSATSVYSVTGYAQSGCAAISSFTQAVDGCVGLPNTKTLKSGARVFPNPNNGKFSIELLRGASVILSNASGELLEKFEFAPGINSVNMNRYSPGVYFVYVRTGGSTEVFKIIRH